MSWVNVRNKNILLLRLISLTLSVYWAREALKARALAGIQTEAPGLCPLVTTTSHPQWHAFRPTRPCSVHTPHKHLCLQCPSDLGMCTPMGCSPSRAWTGEGPNVGPLGSEILGLRYLEHGLKAGRGQALRVVMFPWPRGFTAPLEGRKMSKPEWVWTPLSNTG